MTHSWLLALGIIAGLFGGLLAGIELGYRRGRGLLSRVPWSTPW